MKMNVYEVNTHGCLIKSRTYTADELNANK